MESDSELLLDAVFTEPPRPPTPEPSYQVYVRESEQIHVRLVGAHPLWGNHLWNAARACASYLDANSRDLCQDRTVLELGAGGALPSLIAAKNRASRVVITDYPDAALLDNVRHNVEKNLSAAEGTRVSVQGYVWGRPVKQLLDALPDARSGFDLIVLSDLIFNHSQHDALLTTCEQALAQDKDGSTSLSSPSVLVFYTHHRPHLAHRDMQFFAKARERGWTCDEILIQAFEPMFPDDPGEEEIRATVHGWRLWRRHM